MGLQAVAVADGVGELLAVGRVAHRAGQHGDRGLGSRGRRSRPGTRQRVEHALHRVVAQPAVGVDAGARAGSPCCGARARRYAAVRRARRSAAGSSWSRCRRRRRYGRHAQLTGWGIGRPSSAASRLSTASSAIRSRAVWVAEPMWGTTIRLGADSSGSSAGSGSGSVTSSAAPAIVAGVQRRAQRDLIDDRPARGVDEDRRRLHPLQRGGVDQVAGLGGQRAVQRDEVRALEQLRPARRRERASASSTSISKPAARRATASPIRPPPMIPSVAPCTSWPRWAAGSQVTHSPAATAALRLRQPARGAEQQREGQVGGGVGEHVGGVADRDPARRAAVEVDVVVADRVVGDRPQLRRAVHQLGVDAVGQHRQQPLGLGGAPPQLVVAGRHPLGPDVDLVGLAPAGRARGRAAARVTKQRATAAILANRRRARAAPADVGQADSAGPARCRRRGPAASAPAAARTRPPARRPAQTRPRPRTRAESRWSARRARSCRRACRSELVCAVAIAASTASPSAPPNSREVLTSPEASPASVGATPATARDRRPARTTGRSRSRPAARAPSTSPR